MKSESLQNRILVALMVLMSYSGEEANTEAGSKELMQVTDKGYKA